MTSGTLIRQARLRARLSQVAAVGAERQGPGADRPLGTGRRCSRAWRRCASCCRPAASISTCSSCSTSRPTSATTRGCAKELARTPQERLQAMLEARRTLMAPRTGSIRTRCCEALERHRVAYVVIGALGRVLQGSGEITDGARHRAPRCSREPAPARAGPRGPERSPPGRQGGGARARPRRRPMLELATDAGELKIVPEPAGTRGYDDLRRGARREPIGQGLRPQVASVDDHARMLAVLARDAGPRSRCAPCSG